jgi:hypothetical protein
MRQLLAAVVMVVLVAISGCSSQAEVPAAPAAPAENAVAPPTTAKPKALSRAAAAKRYLEIVRPYNLALEGLEQAFNAGESIVRLRPLAERVAGSNAAQMRQLRATAWPSAVRAPMKRLLAESAAAQPYWRQAAEAGSREELARSVVAADRHNGTDVANEIRHALGLDPYDETDVT